MRPSSHPSSGRFFANNKIGLVSMLWWKIARENGEAEAEDEAGKNIQENSIFIPPIFDIKWVRGGVRRRRSHTGKIENCFQSLTGSEKCWWIFKIDYFCRRLSCRFNGSEAKVRPTIGGFIGPTCGCMAFLGFIRPSLRLFVGFAVLRKGSQRKLLRFQGFGQAPDGCRAPRMKSRGLSAIWWPFTQSKWKMTRTRKARK